MTYVNSITLSPDTLTLTAETWYHSLAATVCPESATCKEVVWHSDNTDVATVNEISGYIYAKAPGTANIYATTVDGSNVSNSCQVTVQKPIAVSSLYSPRTQYCLAIGETKQLPIFIFPENATNQSLVWRSCNDDIVSVDYMGQVMAHTTGSTTVTAAAVDGGFSVQFKIMVVIDHVVIEKDGEYDKVIFQSTGKIWNCINQDIVFVDPSTVRHEVYRRANSNFFTHYDEDPMELDRMPREYTNDEIKLLYAIDPYGVADYVRQYASQKEGGPQDTLKYKDDIFRLLFGRDPKYFVKTQEGNWIEIKYKGYDIKQVSESEAYFGIHQIVEFNLNVLWDFLPLVGKLVDIVRGTTFFEENPIEDTVKQAVQILSIGEEKTHQKIITCAIDKTLEWVFEKINLKWAYTCLQWAYSLDSLVDIIDVEDNFCNEVVHFCADVSKYDIILKLTNGQMCYLKDVDAIIQCRNNDSH